MEKKHCIKCVVFVFEEKEIIELWFCMILMIYVFVEEDGLFMWTWLGTVKEMLSKLND